MNPFQALRLTPRQRLENLAGLILPWLMTVVGFLGAHLYIDQFTRHDRVHALAIIQAVVFPPAMTYLIQLSSIRRFENLLRRIPWEEIRLTLVTGRELHEWVVRRYFRQHLVVFLLVYPLTWVPILLDCRGIVPLGPLLFILSGGLVGTIYLFFVGTNRAFYELLRPGSGYFAARLRALAHLLIRWCFLLGGGFFILYCLDLSEFMGIQGVYPDSLTLIPIARILLLILALVVVAAMVTHVIQQLRSWQLVVKGFERALKDEEA